MIAGTNSGCGKTTVTCAVLQALVNRKINVSSFKCGPDYIDPMFHKTVIGTAAYNLDTYLMSNDAVNYLLNKNSGDIAVIEGVMGFYDGFSFTEKGSTHELSEITDTDVILVVNCRGMSLSAMALVKGFKEFRKNNIKGVIFNNLSEKLYGDLSEECRKIGLVPLGFLPNIKDVQISSRHLGLVTAGEIDGIKDKMNLLADYAEKYIDIDKILEISENDRDTKFTSLEITKKYNVKIAVAYDRAFCFYYEENKRALRQQGLELVEFSPMEDKKLPEGICGLYLGGGYPELHAGKLSENSGMRHAIFEAVRHGMPTIAECGGFLYLGRSLEGADGIVYPMAGVLPGQGFRVGRLVRFGYAKLTARTDSMLFAAGECLPVHEFHHWDTTANGEAFAAAKADGRQWACGFANEHLYAGFPHLYWAGTPLPKRFADAAGRYIKERT